MSAIQLLRFFVAVIVLLSPFISPAQNSVNDSTFTQTAKIIDTNEKNDSSQIIKKADPVAGNSALEQKLGIRISKDALDDVVVATATDSAVMDIKTNNFRLYGNAKVDFSGRKLAADQIEFNQSTNIATATSIEDTGKKQKTLPTFEQGTEKFTYDHLQYNFKSQRAIVRNARSQYGEGFVHSEQIKRNADQSLYGLNNVYTTCSLPHPHFGIRTNKIKIIPEQAIAMGSANIEIEGVPTPIFLPFGYFPVNNESHRSGFILPGYVVEQRRGLGFTKGGYYFYLNDYVDLELRADIFTKGSYTTYLTSNYINKYKYSGQVYLSYGLSKTGEEFDPLAQIEKTFSLKWSHYKDAKSLPGVSFNANVNISSGNYYQLTSNNANQITQNIFQSNITYAKSWIGKPYSLSIALNHEQNNTNREVSVSFPTVTFFVMPQNVFARKNPVGAARWYEKISVGYSNRLVNRLTFYDTSFQLDQLQSKDFKNGMIHNVPVSASYNVLRFINMTFNANYNEYWNTSKSYRRYNDTTDIQETSIEQEFSATRDFNAGVSFNTSIYGMKLFKKGKIKGIRHKLTPALGVNFRPDFARNPFNYYYQTRLDTSQRLTYVSPYEQSIIGGPPTGKEGRLNFTLGNNLQMKVRSKKDTVSGFKNISLLDAFDFNTSYNLAADSFQWDMYRFNARTSIAGLLNISANAYFDPYQYDYNTGLRTTRTTLASGNGIARFAYANVAFGTGFHSKPKTNRDDDPRTKTEDYKSLMRNNGYGNYIDFNIPWSLNLTYALDLTRRPSIYSHSDTSVFTQSVSVNGDFNLTPRWKFLFSSGYNFVDKKIAISQFTISRDLHCFDMRLSLVPFGLYRNFNFQLNVKAQVLQDLKLTKHRDFRDTPY